MSAAVKASSSRHASNGNNASGIWSRPLARLLVGMPNRRLQKLEKRSPAIAKPDQKTGLPTKPDNRRGCCGCQPSQHDAAYRLRGAEQRPPVGKCDIAVERMRISLAEQFLAISGVPFASI